MTDIASGVAVACHSCSLAALACRCSTVKGGVARRRLSHAKRILSFVSSLRVFPVFLAAALAIESAFRRLPRLAARSLALVSALLGTPSLEARSFSFSLALITLPLGTPSLEALNLALVSGLLGTPVILAMFFAIASGLGPKNSTPALPLFNQCEDLIAPIRRNRRNSQSLASRPVTNLCLTTTTSGSPHSFLFDATWCELVKYFTQSSPGSQLLAHLAP